MLRNKTPAPEFDLVDETGTTRSLASLRQDRPFLLLFSRFEECPTAQRDLIGYANVYGRLKMLDADMAAITVDTPQNHRRLRERLGLPFPLLSDPDFAVSERYGVYRSDEVDEGPQPHGEPALFVIEAPGTIACSQVLTAPKGLANPSEIVLLFLYMNRNGGRYW